MDLRRAFVAAPALALAAAVAHAAAGVPPDSAPGADAELAVGTQTAEVWVDGKDTRKVTPIPHSRALRLHSGIHIFRFTNREGRWFEYSVRVPTGISRLIIPRFGSPPREGWAVLVGMGQADRRDEPQEADDEPEEADDELEEPDDGSDDEPRVHQHGAAPKTAQQALQRTNRAILLGDFKDAVAMGNLALKMDPSLAEAHKLLGVAHARQQEYCNARREYEAFLKAAPNGGGAERIRAILGSPDLANCATPGYGPTLRPSR